MGGCSCVSPHRGMKRKGLFEIQWWTFGIERVCGGWFLIKSGLKGCGNVVIVVGGSWVGGLTLKQMLRIWVEQERKKGKKRKI